MESGNQQSQQRDRIHIDESHHEIYVALTPSKEKELPGEEGHKSLFASMKNVFMLAVFIGYRQKKREPLKSKVGIFSWAQLSYEKDVPLLRALALAETKQLEVLANQGEILTVAEEYANIGIIEIKEKIADMPDNRIMHLVSLLGSCIPDDLIIGLVEDAN